MLTQVKCLVEKPPMMDKPRIFRIQDETLGLDLNKVVYARTFNGKILMSSIGDCEVEMEMDSKLVDLFFDGGFQIATILTNELKELLFTEHKEGDENTWN